MDTLALNRAKNKNLLHFGNSEPLLISNDENDAIKRLVCFRNEFEHFKPQGWSIEVTGMPKIIRHILRVIRFLALESNSITYETEDQENVVRHTLENMEARLLEESAAS